MSFEINGLDANLAPLARHKLTVPRPAYKHLSGSIRVRGFRRGQLRLELVFSHEHVISFRFETNVEPNDIANVSS